MVYIARIYPFMNKQRKIDILIIGSGPAGYTASIYASRALLNSVLVTGPQTGGQLTITTDVENYPGFSSIIQGSDLMENMHKQAQSMGGEILEETITKIDVSKSPYLCMAESGLEFLAKSIIIATGAQAKWLGLDSEEKFKGSGVSACATCDGFFFRNKTIAVIGGGNTAVEEALFLTKFAKKIYLIHRRNQLRAEKILQKRLFANPKIKLVWNSEVKEIMGNEDPLKLTSIRLFNKVKQDVFDLSVEGVFIAIGHQPSTELFRGQVLMKPNGYIITEPDSTQTSVKGVFAAGDVTDEIFRQAVTAAGMGCMAALEAERYLSKKEED